MRATRVARPGRTSLASSEGRGGLHGAYDRWISLNRYPHALRSSGTCHPFQAVNKVNGVGWHALDERVLRVRKGVEAYTELTIVGYL